jgi:hypothetical protein
MRFGMKSPTSVALVFGAVVFLASFAGVVAGAADPPARSETQTAPQPAVSGDQPAAGYAGPDTCVVCHEDKATQLAATQHGRAANPRTPAAAQSCETCHGPGQAHADAGGDPALIKSFTKITPREVTETCTTCHNRGDHAMWDGSPHDRRNLTCTTCHSVHSPKSRERHAGPGRQDAVHDLP